MNAQFKVAPAVLRPVPPPRRPLKQWGMDLTALPKTPDGFRYLVVAVDYLTKFPEAKPIKTKEASEILSFFDDLCSRYGFPKVWYCSRITMMENVDNAAMLC